MFRFGAARAPLLQVRVGAFVPPNVCLFDLPVAFLVLTIFSPTVAYKVAMKFLRARDAGDEKVFQSSFHCSCDQLMG
jgi:hypothetical protein